MKSKQKQAKSADSNTLAVVLTICEGCQPIANEGLELVMQLPTGVTLSDEDRTQLTILVVKISDQLESLRLPQTLTLSISPAVRRLARVPAK